LLEILVVVAIIAFLAAIVVAALSTAQKKGQDASIKTQLDSLRSQAEIYAVVGSYNNLFTGNNTWASADSATQAILTGINKVTTVHTAGSSGNAWAAQAQLKTDTTQYMCVDSLAEAKLSTTAMAAGSTVCP